MTWAAEHLETRLDASARVGYVALRASDFCLRQAQQNYGNEGSGTPDQATRYHNPNKNTLKEATCACLLVCMSCLFTHVQLTRQSCSKCRSTCNTLHERRNAHVNRRGCGTVNMGPPSISGCTLPGVPDLLIASKQEWTMDASCVLTLSATDQR